jgi:hypothetical protein
MNANLVAAVDLSIVAWRAANELFGLAEQRVYRTSRYSSAYWDALKIANERAVVSLVAADHRHAAIDALALAGGNIYRDAKFVMLPAALPALPANV